MRAGRDGKSQYPPKEDMHCTVPMRDSIGRLRQDQTERLRGEIGWYGAPPGKAPVRVRGKESIAQRRMAVGEIEGWFR